MSAPPRGVPTPVPAPAGPAAGPVYVASYPKSGNTWFRLVHAAAATGRAPDINAVVDGGHVAARAAADAVLGVPSADLTDDEVAGVRGAVEAVLAPLVPPGALRKVHDPYRPPGGGPPVVAGPPARVVYLVRDPRDVAVSFSHHVGTTPEREAARLADPAAPLFPSVVAPQLPQVLGSWSAHVRSWLDQDDLPLHLVRYEDALADPEGTFGAALRFAGLDVDDAAVAAAVAATSFARLRAQEDRAGFRERLEGARSPFFRQGRAGAWVEELAPAAAARIVADHREVMARLGYRPGPPPPRVGGPERAIPPAAPAPVSNLLRNPAVPAMAPVVSKLTRNRGVAAAGRAAVPWPPPVLAGTVAGPLPDPVVTGPFLAARADEVLLCLPAAGRLRARAGEPLVLDRAPGATDADVRCLVEGPGVTAAWLLAGAVALRGAAVVVDGGAVVLTGAPGLGASTLAAGLALRGHDVLADRVVDIDPEALLVCPRDAALQLDPPTVTALRNGDGARPDAADPGARPGDDPVTAILAGEGEIVRPGIRRRRYALRPAAGPAPLRAVVILERRPGPDIVVEPLTGLAAVRGLQDRAWHPRLVGALGGRAAAFGLAAAVAAAAPVVVLAADRHPRTRPPLAELARRIEALAAG